MQIEQDITGTLQQLLDRARAVLHADSVVVFVREGQTFLPAVIASGELNTLHTEQLAAIVRETGLAAPIYERGMVYLQDENQYREFMRAPDVKQQQLSTEQDFWSRERIKSSAFIRIGGEHDPAGVILVNYRTPQIFDHPTKQLIEAFAFMASVAIQNHRLSLENSEFWRKQLATSVSASISDIVAGLAHNSGNLLFAINARLGYFARKVRKSNADKIDKQLAEDFINGIQEPLNQLDGDLTRLKEYRRLERFVRETCDIHDLIDNSLLMLRNKFERHRITITTRYAPVPPVACDKSAIQHLLLNLLMNAVDAIERNGAITIETDVNKGHLRIGITDNGPGIPVEFRSKIFEPFFTTKRVGAGNGLGLSVSLYIVRQHYGEIEFTSNNKGTTFSVYLPIADS